MTSIRHEVPIPPRLIIIFCVAVEWQGTLKKPLRRRARQVVSPGIPTEDQIEEFEARYDHRTHFFECLSP